VAAGHLKWKTAARHTSAEFLAFLDQVVASVPTRQAIHFTEGNLSAWKTKADQA
jgi:hypothetical protein